MNTDLGDEIRHNQLGQLNMYNSFFYLEDGLTIRNCQVIRRSTTVKPTTTGKPTTTVVVNTKIIVNVKILGSFLIIQKLNIFYG